MKPFAMDSTLKTSEGRHLSKRGKKHATMKHDNAVRNEVQNNSQRVSPHELARGDACGSEE